MSQLEMMGYVKLYNTNNTDPPSIQGSYELPEYNKIVNDLVESGHSDVFKDGGDDKYIDDKFDIVSDKIDSLRNEYSDELSNDLQPYNVMVDFIKNYISKINVNSFKSNS